MLARLQGLQGYKACKVTRLTRLQGYKVTTYKAYKVTSLEEPTTENNLYEILKKLMRLIELIHSLSDKITVVGFGAIFT